jgi:hypothetical protein
MVSPLTRRITKEDYFLIKAAMELHLAKMLKWPNHKAWLKYIDIETCLKHFYASEYAFIIDDAFLVVYDFITPWYAKAAVVYLEETIILRLVPGGNIENVVAFLERARNEAGARLVCTGTALARTDAALASIYHKLGFNTETVILVREPTGTT